MNRQSFGKYVSIILRHQRIVLNRAFKKFGFSSGQYGFFIAIAENQGATQKDLSSELQITKGTTNKAIRKLEYQGFVKTIIDDGDKRNHHVFLTEKGEAIVPEVYKILEDYSSDLSEGLSDEHKEIAFDAIVHMAKNSRLLANDSREDIYE